jgi:hypothetical protein
VLTFSSRLIATDIFLSTKCSFKARRYWVANLFEKLKKPIFSSIIIVRKQVILRTGARSISMYNTTNDEVLPTMVDDYEAL